MQNMTLFASLVHLAHTSLIPSTFHLSQQYHVMENFINAFIVQVFNMALVSKNYQFVIFYDTRHLLMRQLISVGK